MRDIFCALTLAEYSALVNLEVDIAFGTDPVVRKRLLTAMHDIRELGLKRATELSRGVHYKKWCKNIALPCQTDTDRKDSFMQCWKRVSLLYSGSKE